MNRKENGIAVLLHAIDEAYDKSAWHGTNLRGSLRGVTARQADWRPAPGRHNIRELVVHAAYWKRRARERVTGQKGAAFPIPGSNWLKLRTCCRAPSQHRLVFPRIARARCRPPFFVPTRIRNFSTRRPA